MADYYPLIARAIAGLDPSAPGESRRALYERARAALIAQLRSVQPPLSESEITRERISLEDAVRKVESEASQQARNAARQPLARDTVGTRAEARGQRELEAQLEEERQLSREEQAKQTKFALLERQAEAEARLEEQRQKLYEIE